ncbi:hypothetical protein BHM03_00043159, partial [Ensete ventricosum]
MAEIDRRRAISTVAGGPHIGQLADRYISPGRGSYRSVRDLNLESYCTVPEARIGLQLIGTWITRYRVVSAGGQDEEHDGEEDEATVLVGWRRHDEEGSWTWRDTKKHSVGQNAVGVIGIMAAVVWEVAVDSKGRDLGLGWIAASPSRSRQPVKSMVLGTLVYLVLVCSVHTVPITDRYVGMVGFTGSYNEYFGYATDMDAMVYLMLVNDMIHGLYPEAVAIGEDVTLDTQCSMEKSCHYPMVYPQNPFEVLTKNTYRPRAVLVRAPSPLARRRLSRAVAVRGSRVLFLPRGEKDQDD